MQATLLFSYVFLLFLFLGSFLNVVALRTLAGTSVLNPKHSHCPHCNTRLTWRDLMPVLSWLFLRGQCRTCAKPIHWLYPVGELMVAVVMTFVVYHGGFTWETLVVAVLFLFILTVTITDLHAKLMPNKITYPGLIVVCSLRLFIHPDPWWDYALGFLVGGGLLTVLALVSKGGMGGGDIKLFALIGLGLGVETVLFALFYSCLWGTVVGLPLRLTGKIKARQPIPFGPFILLGSWTAWAYGTDIWQAYLHLYR